MPAQEESLAQQITKRLRFARAAREVICCAGGFPANTDPREPRDHTRLQSGALFDAVWDLTHAKQIARRDPQAAAALLDHWTFERISMLVIATLAANAARHDAVNARLRMEQEDREEAAEHAPAADALS